MTWIKKYSCIMTVRLRLVIITSLSPCDGEKVQLYYDCKAKVRHHYISQFIRNVK